MNNKVEFKEVVELFINNIIYEIKNESEIPRFNIVFKEEAYNLFYEIMKSPFKKENSWTPDIKNEDIITLKNININNLPTIYVKDHIKFFYYLTEITNNLLDLYEKFDEVKSARSLSIQIMKRIWLRMNIKDFNDIELFLEKQLNFIKNNSSMKNIYEKNIYNSSDYSIIAKTYVNPTWDESNLSIYFIIFDKINYHTLPRILYDISNNTCYIYGIQTNKFGNRNKEIEKLIYKRFSGNNQPNKVFSLKLFISLLKEYNIDTIRIPIIQVLSYRYHEILSKNEKIRFNKKWTEERVNNINNLYNFEKKWELSEYNADINWYLNIVDKEDTISKLKTEDFINLIYRIIDEDNDLILETDIFTSDELVIKIKKKRLII